MLRSVYTRTASAMAALLAGALLLAGCASGPMTPSTDEPPPGDGAFPVTLHNAYGDVTIKERPKRIAALGYADVALASAMGAEVVLAPESFTSVAGAGDEKNLPYIDPLPDDTTWVNPMSISVEQVASAKPDLILATAAFTLDEAMYQQLSDIAPVVTYEEGLYRATSEESAARVGQALGDPEAAERLIQQADDAIAKTKEELPNLDGVLSCMGRLAMAWSCSWSIKRMSPPGSCSSSGSSPSRDHATRRAGFCARLDRRELRTGPTVQRRGVLFMTYQSDALQQKFESDPIVSQQPIMQQRYVPVGLEAATALQDPNVAAVPWLLDELRAGLELIPAS